MPGERGKGNSVACFHRRKLLYFPLSPYETEAACKPSLAMHLLALLLRLSVILLLSSFFLTGDWSCSSAQPGATWPGALSEQHSPDLWSGCPCLGSYTHSQFNALPTFPLKSYAHVCSWPCSQEMVMHPQETPPMSQRGAVPLQSSVQC